MTIETTKPATAPAVDNLAGLDAVARAADTGIVGPETVDHAGEVQPGGPPNYMLAAQQCVDMFVAMLTGYCEPAAALWTAEKKSNVALSLAPVMEKYKFTLDTMPVELGFLLVAGPLLFQSARMVAAQVARDKQAKTKDQGRTVEVKNDTSKPADANGPGVHDQVRLYPVQ
jgi:hypothetical protein